MLSFRLCLFILSLVVLTLALQPFHIVSTSGGSAMIIDVCSKTPDVNRCETCLNGDPKGKVADIRGLAMIAIGCGKRYAYGLYSKTYGIQTTTDNHRLKDLLTDFYSHLGEVAYNIGNAGPLLQKKGVEAAKQSITVNATKDLTYLLNFSKTSGEPEMKSFINELNDIGTDCGMIVGILNRIVR